MYILFVHPLKYFFVNLFVEVHALFQLVILTAEYDVITS